MIDIALILLRDELTNYLSSKDTATVVGDNIGLLETPGGVNLAENIVITLVNVEEESALKNQSALKRPFMGNAIYQNPPVNLNLYVLFSCNYTGDHYNLALKRLSYIIRFLQSKNVFSVSSSVSGGSVSPEDPDIIDLKFTMELYTLTFEQINHLWGSLGGRQMPFVMYKLRLVTITERATVREVPLIEEIETHLDKIPNT
jgi:Pvc16 N-terminal domain